MSVFLLMFGKRFITKIHFFGIVNDILTNVMIFTKHF